MTRPVSGGRTGASSVVEVGTSGDDVWDAGCSGATGDAGDTEDSDEVT